VTSKFKLSGSNDLNVRSYVERLFSHFIYGINSCQSAWNMNTCMQAEKHTTHFVHFATQQKRTNSFKYV